MASSPLLVQHTPQKQRVHPALLELEDLCLRSGRHLIVREWVTGYYLRWIRATRQAQKIHNLLTLNHLPKEQTRPFALVRHGADTFKSLASDKPEWSEEAVHYAKTYLTYAQDIHESRMPIYPYAELCAHPYEFTEKLCRDLDIPFDKTAVSRFSHIITACGDTAHRGRYAHSRTIHPSMRRVLPDLAQENLFRNNPDFQRADRLLGLTPDSPLSTSTHAKMQKTKKHDKKIPLPALVPYKVLSPPLWRYQDIIGADDLNIPLSERTPIPDSATHYLATIPSNCVIVVLYARYLDRGVIHTLQALDDAPADFPPRAFIIMTRKKRIFLSLPKHLRSRTYIHRLQEDTGEMPDSNLETLSLMRELVWHNKHHTLFLCSKHIIITARHMLPRLLALCPPQDTATALSYGPSGIDTNPLIIHNKKHKTTHLGSLSAYGYKGAPFADRRILFDPEVNNDKPLTPHLQMDFVQRYPELTRRPFVGWTKIYDEGKLLLLFADHNSYWLAATGAQKRYGTLTKRYCQAADGKIQSWRRSIKKRYPFS